MKTQQDILDDMRQAITGTELAIAVNGSIYTDMRPTNSKKEDIFIRVKAVDFGQIQQAIISVHVYFAKVKRGGDLIPNQKRARELMAIATNTLNTYQDTEGWRFNLTNQYLDDAADETQSVIINNIYYSHCNN